LVSKALAEFRYGGITNFCPGEINIEVAV
jgi:hypothetical protein